MYHQGVSLSFGELSLSQTFPDGFDVLKQSYCKTIPLPSPKKKYGFDMANNGPYLAHTWNRYGKVRPLYGTDMGPSFVTFQGMGRVWVF